MIWKCLGVLCFAGSLATASVITSDPNLPPNVGSYDSSPGVHACYTNCGALDLTSLSLSGFSGVVRTPSGADEIENFSTVMKAMISIGLGPFNPIVFTGSGTTRTFGKIGNTTGTFNIEVLSLNLSGGGFLLRESPTLVSPGQATITDVGGGQFRIDSFFDVFTELSLDGGQTWIPNQSGATHLELVPEPAAWGLVLCGLLLASARKRLFR